MPLPFLHLLEQSFAEFQFQSSCSEFPDFSRALSTQYCILLFYRRQILTAHSILSRPQFSSDIININLFIYLFTLLSLAAFIYFSLKLYTFQYDLHIIRTSQSNCSQFIASTIRSLFTTLDASISVTISGGIIGEVM